MNEPNNETPLLNLNTLAAVSWPTEGIYVASLEIDREELEDGSDTAS